MYSILILIGLALTLIIVLIAQNRVRHYRCAFTDEEVADFKKPFRFKFWLLVLISSLVFACCFVPLAYLQSGLMKGV